MTDPAELRMRPDVPAGTTFWFHRLAGLVFVEPSPDGRPLTFEEFRERYCEPQP